MVFCLQIFPVDWVVQPQIKQNKNKTQGDKNYAKSVLEPRHDKTNKMSVRLAKTQISLGIRPVWSESSLCAQWVAKDPSFLHTDSEDSDQSGRMPRLIWVFAGRTLTLLVLSCRGSLIVHFGSSVCGKETDNVGIWWYFKSDFLQFLIRTVGTHWNRLYCLREAILMSKTKPNLNATKTVRTQCLGLLRQRNR